MHRNENGEAFNNYLTGMLTSVTVVTRFVFTQQRRSPTSRPSTEMVGKLTDSVCHVTN